MAKALILGAFQPFHKMHETLFKTVEAMGYELLIGIFVSEGDAIDAKLRASWLEPYGEVLPLPASDAPYENIDLSNLPKFDLIAGSNPKILKTAQALNIPHFLWDPAREAWDLDADDILADPVKHWRDMPAHVRHSIQRRITFVGPESVGKSWFAKKMATQFGTPHIPEYGRPHEKYRKAGDYSGAELSELARRHGASRRALSDLAGPVIFEDTDELMTAVWSEMLLDAPTLEVEAQITLPSQYVLYHWDTPWEEDKLRYFARADLRRKFYERIERKLKEHGADYVEIGGSWEEREAQTIAIVETQLKHVKFI